MAHYKSNKKCITCNTKLQDKNKSGYCVRHRNVSGVNNGFYGKKHKKESIEQARIKLRQTSKNLWKNKEYREKIIKGVSKPRIESFKKEQSIRVTEWYKNNPEQKKRSISMQKSWLNGKIKHHASNSSNKSSKQLQFLKDLQVIFPDIEGDKTLRSGKKHYFPDTIFCKIGVIIEYYGDYWHANPKKYKATDIVHHNLIAQNIWDHDKSRNQALEDKGYTIYIIWESDYDKNKKLILENFDNLLNWETCGL